MTLFLASAGLTAFVLSALALVLSILDRISQRLAAVAIRAPGLDVLVSLFTWFPLAVAAYVGGWRGFLGVHVGQVVALYLFAAAHEMAHPRAMRGPRIVRILNRIVGRWRNHLALWATLLALPAFLCIRIGEVVMYPILTLLVGFPSYRQAEWVNVSRQKFSGLVGHDLTWCLYCDWMTGVYSLGAEMLRNVESFWCPIRFYDGKKCANCKLDFPDLDNGWVPASGTMTEVAQTLETQYGDGRREWFGHPVRITLNGQPVESQPEPTEIGAA